MYYATGIPGIGRGGGPGRRPQGPVADTARPAARDDPSPGLSREDELRMLEEEEMMLKQEIDDLDRTIGGLRKNKEREVNK